MIFEWLLIDILPILHMKLLKNIQTREIKRQFRDQIIYFIIYYGKHIYVFSRAGWIAPPHSSYIQKPRTIRVNHSMLVNCLNLIQIHFRVVITYHGKCGIYRHCCFMTRIIRWKEVSWDLSLFQPMRDHAALQVTNQMMERKIMVCI